MITLGEVYETRVGLINLGGDNSEGFVGHILSKWIDNI